MINGKCTPPPHTHTAGTAIKKHCKEFHFHLENFSQPKRISLNNEGKELLKCQLRDLKARPEMSSLKQRTKDVDLVEGCEEALL